MNKRDKYTTLRKVGNMEQLCYIRKVRYQGGFADTQAAHEVNNGRLSFTVMDTACMDIGEVRYRNVPVSYLSKAGWQGNRSMPKRYIMGGMFFTAGLNHVGPGEGDMPLHGLARLLPGSNVCAKAGWQGGEYRMSVEGEMRQGMLFGENLVLRRSIVTTMDSDVIRITDVLENEGFKDETVMLLYHFNVGYPILDEGACLVVPSKTYTPRDQATVESRGDTDPFVMDGPVDNQPEQVYYHELGCDKKGDTFCALVNKEKKLAVCLHFNKTQLPVFSQWKSIASGDYVMGMELGICHVEGPQREREMGSARVLKAGETMEIAIDLEILEGNEAIEKLFALGETLKK